MKYMRQFEFFQCGYSSVYSLFNFVVMISTLNFRLFCIFICCYYLSNSFLDRLLVTKLYNYHHFNFIFIRRKIKMNINLYNSNSYDYLINRDPNVYINNVLKKSIDSTKLCINNNITKIEISFPEIIKNDISVIESLNLNRAFVLEYIKSFTSYGKNLWVVFPDNKELKLALDKWDNNNDNNNGDKNIKDTFTITSLSVASKILNANNNEDNGLSLQLLNHHLPEVLVIVNPGFNVNEWIDLANLNTNAIVIVINGNLDRLRNGYYPSIFYPTLTKVTNTYYRSFIQAFFIQNIAVNGDRYGGWLLRNYPNNWMIVIKNKDNKYERLTEYDQDQQPNAQIVWKTAKIAYQRIWGGMF